VSPHDVFSGLNLIAGIGWALLVLFPRKRWVDAVAGKAIPALLAVVYAAIVAAQWRGSEGGFSSLTEVATLFANPWILLAGWIHYLAFDLFVGCWEVRDAAERDTPSSRRSLPGPDLPLRTGRMAPVPGRAVYSPSRHSSVGGGVLLTEGRRVRVSRSPRSPTPVCASGTASAIKLPSHEPGNSSTRLDTNVDAVG